jgi:hypothetical protein
MQPENSQSYDVPFMQGTSRCVSFFFIPANRWFGKATLRRFLGYGMWQLSISHGMDDTCVTF